MRIGNLVRHLSQTFDIDLLVFLGGTDDPPHRQALGPFCRRIHFQRLPDPPGDVTRRLPPAAAVFDSRSVRERVRSLVEGHDLDLVVLEYAELGHLASTVPRAVPVVLVEHDIHFRSLERRNALDFGNRFDGVGGGGDALRFRDYELETCRRVDQIHVMSEADRSFLARELGTDGGRIRVVPNGVDTERYRPAEPPSARSRDVLFVGSFPHLPNQDALEFFLAEAWPEIRRRRPGTRLTVAGARPPAWVLALDPADGIDAIGEVDDLLPLYRSHRVLVAPIRAGSGTRLKILEALACGLPVVSTPLGAEGLDLDDGVHLALAAEPSDLVAATLRCLDDPFRADSMAHEGRRRVEELYDWKVIAERAARDLLGLLVDRPLTRGAETSESLDPSADPEISLIVAGGSPGSDPSIVELRDRLEAQSGGRSFEILWLGGDTAPEIHGAVRNLPFPDVWNAQDPAPCLDRAATAARGEILVFLGPDFFPLEASWLRDLTEPLFAPLAPAAVQGGINSGYRQGPPRCETRLSETWAESHGGVTFSWCNAAVRRDVWESFPFASGGAHQDRRWQCRIEEAGQQVLSIWGALAEERSPRHPLADWGSAWRRGRSWSLLGLTYRLRDCLRDLIAPRVHGGQRVRILALLARHGLRGIASWGQPAVEWLGNRVGRRASE